jgi:hypothetical protein
MSSQSYSLRLLRSSRSSNGAKTCQHFNASARRASKGSSAADTTLGSNELVAATPPPFRIPGSGRAWRGGRSRSGGISTD